MEFQLFTLTKAKKIEKDRCVIFTDLPSISDFFSPRVALLFLEEIRKKQLVYIYIYIACINLCWLGECRSLFTRYIRLVTCKRWVERGRPRLIPGEYGILMKRRISPIASIDFANRGNPRIGGGFLKKKIERIKKEKR